MQSPKISILGVGYEACEFFDKLTNYNNISVNDVNFVPLALDKEDLYILGKDPSTIFIDNFDNFSKIILKHFSDTDIVFIVSDCCVNLFIASEISSILKRNGGITIGAISAPWGCTNYCLRNIHRREVFFDLCAYNLQKVFEFLTSLIFKSGLVNLDFDDIKNFLKDSSVAIYSTGYFGGYNKFSNATLQVITNISTRIKNIKNLLVNIITNSDVSLV